MGSGIERAIDEDNACRHERAAASLSQPAPAYNPNPGPIASVTCIQNGMRSLVESTDRSQGAEEFVRMAFQALTGLGFTPCCIADWFIEVGLEYQKSED